MNKIICTRKECEMLGGRYFFEKIMNQPGKIRLIDRDKRKEETGSAVSKATG